MPRALRWSLVLFALTLIASIAAAQPSGGGAGTPTPSPRIPVPRPPSELRDFEDLFENPEQAWTEFQDVFASGIEELVAENRERLNENAEALPEVLSSSITRIVALILGALLLIVPEKSKIWAWVFLGAVIALVISQLPLGQEIRFEMSSGNDMRFMRNEPLGTFVLVGIGALMGLSVLSPLFFFGMAGAGALAGGVIATQITGGTVEPAVLTVGSIIGFILTLTAITRAGFLVPLAIGAALVVFAAGLGPTLMIPIMIVAGFISLIRSNQGARLRKREKLPTLKLQEGKVVVAKDDKPAREHLHEILPTLSDDSDSPLIRR